MTPNLKISAPVLIQTEFRRNHHIEDWDRMISELKRDFEKLLVRYVTNEEKTRVSSEAVILLSSHGMAEIMVEYAIIIESSVPLNQEAIDYITSIIVPEQTFPYLRMKVAQYMLDGGLGQDIPDIQRKCEVEVFHASAPHAPGSPGEGNSGDVTKSINNNTKQNIK